MLEIIVHDKADEVTEKLFRSLLAKYQIGLETSMTGCDFKFDCVHLLHYKCYKINFKWDGSNTDYSNWIKNKKAVTFALNHEEIRKPSKE